MPDYLRELSIFADGRQIGQGCRVTLEARERLTLRPALHHLVLYDLSESSAALLPQVGRLEIRGGNAVLAFGEPVEVLTQPRNGHQVTSVVFSPGLSLWQSSVSLSIIGGMKASDTIRQLLTASGTSIPLAAYAAQDPVFARPQAFFGRACDALALLAKAAEADVYLSPAGVCVCGRNSSSISITLPERSLLSEPIQSGDRWILSTTMGGWNPGGLIEFTWKGITYSGRLTARLIQADNVSGPWKSELEVEASHADD